MKEEKEKETEKEIFPVNVVDENNKNNNDENNSKENDKIILNNILIEPFFLLLNYNTNDVVDDIQFLQKKVVMLLNNISLTNITIDFKEYKNENNILSLKDAIKNIYEFYSNDILNLGSVPYVKGVAPIVSALPLFNHISSMIDGMLNIVREPIQKYKNNESVIDGFVHGVTSCVVNTSTIFTHLGERISNYFNFLGCTPKSGEDELNSNTCRKLRHMINEENKDIENYYFK